MAVLLMNAESTPATRETKAIDDRSPNDASLSSTPPMRSTTPVSHTACPMTSMPATIMSVSFPNPANARSNPMMPNTAMAKAPNSAVTGSGKASVTNRIMTTANMMSATAACDTSEHRLSHACRTLHPHSLQNAGQ